MRQILFGATLVLALLSDVYIWGTYLRATWLPWQAVHFLPTVCIVGLLVVMSRREVGARLFQAMFVLLLCFVLPKIVFTICSIIGQGLGMLYAPVSVMMNIVGLSLSCVIVGSSSYGLIWGWKRLSERSVSIESEKLPEGFDGFRIVQLSDLHIGVFEREEQFVERMVERVNELKPNLIVFTGDLVSVQSAELRPFIETLSKLKSDHGVISILGNHDYAIYGTMGTDAERMEKDIERLKGMQREMGWAVLQNESCIIKRSEEILAIIGVEYEGRSGGIHRAELGKAMSGIPEGAFPILLTHDPAHWRSEVVHDTEIPLTLSGHTHAGQLRIGHFSLAQLFLGKECDGLYREGEQQLFVSAGVGGMLPFRLGAWPEIDLITLHKSEYEK